MVFVGARLFFVGVHWRRDYFLVYVGFEIIIFNYTQGKDIFYLFNTFWVIFLVLMRKMTRKATKCGKRI